MNKSGGFADVSGKDHYRVGVFLDGRPGHEKQSLGIVDWLARNDAFTVDVLEFQTPRPSFGRRLYQYLRWLLVYPEASFSRAASLDLLIGTGSATHLPLLYCRKKYGVPIVTCMFPEPFLAPFFDLCIVPEHDGIGPRSNVLFTLGAPNRSLDKGQHKENRGLLLFGGSDPGSHLWDSDRILQMAADLISENPDIQWVGSSSPRTPVECSDDCRNLAQKFANFHFFDYRETPRGWVEEQYDLARHVWITADSISMIYEALTAGCEVGLLPVQWSRGGGKFARNEEMLIARGLVKPYDARHGCVTGMNHTSFNEARKCADYIVKELWKRN